MILKHNNCEASASAANLLMKLVTIVHLFLERFPALQGAGFKAWFWDGSRVLAAVKSPAMVPKGNSVSTARVQVSRPGSGMGPGCWL